MFLQTIFLFLVTSIVNSLQFDFIKPLKEKFDLSQPFITSRTKIVYDKHILKTFSNHGEYVSFKNSCTTIPQKTKFNSHIILIPNNIEDINAELDCLKKYDSKTFLLLGDSLFAYAFANLRLEINQEIFFIKERTNEIFETYDINGIQIRRKLGMLTNEKIVWEQKVEPSFLKRRANFHGLTLKALTEISGNDVMIDSKFKKNAPYFETNQTFLVNGYVTGLHYDILRLMEINLNFTTQLFKPKDENWGFMKTINGTLKGTGMVGDLFNKKADLLWTTIALLYDER